MTSRRDDLPDSNDLPDSYLTLADRGEAELKVQRSRFLASARPTASVAEARAAITEVARQYHDCRHICHAWRLGVGAELQEARSDAGEPAGSAGTPILTAIRTTGLSDCVVVVARYFGGVKLGTGGLSRAYGGAAQKALAAAPPRTIRLGRTFSLTLPYEQIGNLKHLLARCEGRLDSEDYAATVSWRIWLPHSRWREFAAALKEATAGSIEALPD